MPQGGVLPSWADVALDCRLCTQVPSLHLALRGSGAAHSTLKKEKLEDNVLLN